MQYRTFWLIILGLCTALSQEVAVAAGTGATHESSSPNSAATQRKCDICLEEKPTSDFIALSCNKEHMFCKQCLRDFVDNALKSKDVLELKCPLCRALFNAADVRAITAGQPEKEREFLKLKQEQEAVVQQGPNDMSAETKKALGIEPCPKCHVNIQKAQGCWWMLCSKCKYPFCWYCKTYSPYKRVPRGKGYGIIHPHPFNKCAYAPKPQGKMPVKKKSPAKVAQQKKKVALQKKVTLQKKVATKQQLKQRQNIRQQQLKQQQKIKQQQLIKARQQLKARNNRTAVKKVVKKVAKKPATA